MFRTQTGQTGRDAYIYELAAIRNARRALDRQMLHLIEVMTAELPRDAKSSWEMTAGYRVETDRDTILRMIELSTLADDVSMDTVAEILENLQVGEES